MPQLLAARPAKEAGEAGPVRKLAASRHAPGEWLRRARLIGRSGDGRRTAAIAAEVGWHPQTVRQRLTRFTGEGLDGLGDRPGSGRKRRLTEGERRRISALVGNAPPGRLVPAAAGELVATAETGAAPWPLTARTTAAREAGSAVARSPVRRSCVTEGVRWRHPRSWATSTDPAFVPQEQRAARSTPSRPPRRPSAVSTSAVP
jgi:transposase